MPRPMQAATARAAGARTTDSDGAKLPRSPCDGGQSQPHDCRGPGPQSRAAQTSRTPRPTDERQGGGQHHAPGQRGTGRPGRWRSGAPRPSRARWRRSSGQPEDLYRAASRPGRCPTTQGASSDAGETTTPAHGHHERPARSTRAAPTMRAPRAQATAATSTIGTTAGANAAAMAMTAPRAAIWPERARPPAAVPAARRRRAPCRRPGPGAER